MTKIHMAGDLIGVDGEIMKWDAAGAPATLQRICIEALGAILDGDERRTGGERLKLQVLGALVLSGDVVDLVAEDIATLKDRIAGSVRTADGKTTPLFNAFVLGAAWNALDHPKLPDEEPELPQAPPAPPRSASEDLLNSTAPVPERTGEPIAQVGT